MRTLSRTAVDTLALVSLVIACCGPVFAAEPRRIEEILVTAQRFEEEISKVPIAVTAFNEAMIEDRQIIGLADLQMNVPNVTFTPRQGSFSGSFQIRGIGLQPAGGSSETPSAMHVNEIPFPRLTRAWISTISNASSSCAALRGRCSGATPRPGP